jgi:hypothetical protein
MPQSPTPKDLDDAFFMLARWIGSPAGTHGETGDRAIRALRCLRLSRVADRASALIAAADDPATLDRWKAMKTDHDAAEAHLLHLLNQRTRWLRECEKKFEELGIRPPHYGPLPEAGAMSTTDGLGAS